MNPSERAFTYEPGRSLLHRWADRDSNFFRFRLTSKLAVFFMMSFLVARLRDRIGAWPAIVTDLLIIVAALALLATSTSGHKAWALMLELWVIARLTVSVALPVLALVLSVTKAMHISTGYTFRELPLVFATLALAVSTLLAIAALFMATTSLADIVTAMPGSGRGRMFISLTLIALAQAEPNIVQRQVALRGLKCPSGRSRSIQAFIDVLSAPGALFYLIAALVWQVLAVDSVPIYLTLRSEMSSLSKQIN